MKKYEVIVCHFTQFESEAAKVVQPLEEALNNGWTLENATAVPVAVAGSHYSQHYGKIVYVLSKTNY
jgi:hypothetical protein